MGGKKKNSYYVTEDMQEPSQAYCQMREANLKWLSIFVSSYSAFCKGTCEDTEKIIGARDLVKGRKDE